MSVFDHAEFDEHESVHFFQDPASGLSAIIAVHSTALGPAAGGCRRWVYTSDADAITDVLRLSRGMTYKNAIAGLPFGGGKAVILVRNEQEKSPELFAAFGRAVESLQGRYITAEDVGIAIDDMRQVRQQTRFVSGLPKSGELAGGDPSPYTALGVFQGLQATVTAALGNDSLQGVKVAVQGVGSVGYHLCKLLHEAGAILTIADVNRKNLQRVMDQMPATEVAATDILFADVDVLAPCALGSVIDEQTIPQIRASVIAGAANNQLALANDGQRLMDLGILYAPDYVINAGGIINVAHEYNGDGSEEQVRSDIAQIPLRLRRIYDESSVTGQPTNIIADEMARRIVIEKKSDDANLDGNRRIA